VLTIRPSRAYRDSVGVTVAVPLGDQEATCPIGALRRWLEATTVSAVVRDASFAGSIGMDDSAGRSRTGRWPRLWRAAPLASKQYIPAFIQLLRQD
jgi:hypothetical protein